jgi:hypothetical protein
VAWLAALTQAEYETEIAKRQTFIKAAIDDGRIAA